MYALSAGLIEFESQTPSFKVNNHTCQFPGPSEPRFTPLSHGKTVLLTGSRKGLTKNTCA
jgi:hypothetical protein